MISKIIVPTDFSLPAAQALDYAIAIAKKFGSSLTLLHVNQVAMVDSTMPAETYQMFVKEIEDQTAIQFKDLEEKVLKACGIQYEIQSRYGFVAEEICNYAQKHQADMIILGTTGASGAAAEVLFGSNAASVVSKSQTPIMVIPADSVYMPLNRIVYATDYNEPEFPSAMLLVHFAGQFNCPLDILHVKSDADKYYNAENNYFKRERDNIPYANINFIELEKGDVINSINQYVEEKNADLLVMAKHNRNFFDRIFHRSMSKKMAFHSRIPLLVLMKN